MWVITRAAWTRRLADDDVAIRLWTGFSWLEFGKEGHLLPHEVERLSDPLEFEQAE